jgi:sporulation protein YlmC with PRC-barrel domain
MKLKYTLLISAVIAAGFSLSIRAEPTPAREVNTGAEKSISEFNHIRVKNFQDESLGRIMDLGIDLINGRIVEVLVESDSSLEVNGKIVAVPPLALLPDALNEVYRLDVSTDVFKSAPAIDLSHWLDAGRSERVAAAYRIFGQDPYFLEEGDTASMTAKRPKVSLGYVERSSKILDLPVGNLQNEQFGKVWSLTLDLPKGRILNVIVLAPGNFKTKSIIPAMALSFNAKRDALLLDVTKIEYADEPRYIFTEAAYGNSAHFERESYKGPRTSVALEQGRSYRDVDLTVRINRDIRAAKINAGHVEVGTINDRITLRGWVDTDEDKRRIGEIAIADAPVKESVDNQITVGKPAANN